MSRSLLLALACVLLGAAEPDPVLASGSGRIVLVGDSITGLSRNHPQGYAHLMEAALRHVHPGASLELVSLGGSGQSVESWQEVERRHRDHEGVLDVKGVAVKVNLDRHADALVVSLGMNNVLAPYTDESPASLDRWCDRYRALVAALRARTTPTVTAFATVTPCTESPTAPRNRLVGLLNQRIRALAAEAGARVVDSGGSVQELLDQGRRIRPDFHVTYDFVHPNHAGNLGIARAMLRALGEPEAAAWIEARDLPGLLAQARAGAPSLSWRLAAAAGPRPGTVALRIAWWWPDAPAGAAPQADLVAPAGWTVARDGRDLVATGVLDRLRTPFTLRATLDGALREAVVQVPAPWLTGGETVRRWSGPGLMEFIPADHATPFDACVAAGAALPGIATWVPLLPDVDLAGGDDPGSADLSAVSACPPFASAYLVRWIRSDRPRTVDLRIGTAVFAGDMHIQVWCGGREVHRGMVPRTPALVPAAGVELQAGWNRLVVKTAHRNWQWQQSISLAGRDGDDLADLRYAIAEPAGSGDAMPK